MGNSKKSFAGIALFLFLLSSNFAQAKIISKQIEYKDDNIELKGYLAYDDAAKGRRPTPPSRDCAASASLLVCCRRGDGIYARTLQRGISHHPRAASGLAVAWAPAVIAVMSLVFAASAYPAGRLQDKIGARPLLILGLVALIAADLLLGFGQSLVVLFIGIGLWGLHMGLTQGVLSALVAAMAPEHCAAPPSASLASSPGLLPWARACWPGPSGT